MSKTLTPRKTPSTRKTITLADARWTAIERYKTLKNILTGTEALDRLLCAGLAVEMPAVIPATKRKSI